jgi:hypothetical protein
MKIFNLFKSKSKPEEVIEKKEEVLKPYPGYEKYYALNEKGNMVSLGKEFEQTMDSGVPDLITLIHLNLFKYQHLIGQN